VVVGGREASGWKNFLYKTVVAANMLAGIRVNWGGKYMTHGG